VGVWGKKKKTNRKKRKIRISREKAQNGIAGVAGGYHDQVSKKSLEGRRVSLDGQKKTQKKFRRSRASGWIGG